MFLCKMSSSDRFCGFTLEVDLCLISHFGPSKRTPSYQNLKESAVTFPRGLSVSQSIPEKPGWQLQEDRHLEAGERLSLITNLVLFSIRSLHACLHRSSMPQIMSVIGITWLWEIYLRHCWLFCKWICFVIWYVNGFMFKYARCSLEASY